MIPPVLHFIWIQDQKPFSQLEYLSIKSAIKNTPYKIILHTNLNPGQAGPFDPFPLISDRFSVDIQNYICEYRGIKIRAPMLSDLLRIQILAKYGGIYSDLDMIWLAPLPVDLASATMIAPWQNQSYKILATYVLAVQENYNFFPLQQEFEAIFDMFQKKGKDDIPGKTLDEYLLLYRATAKFFKERADVILKKKFFEKNTWKNIWRFLTDQIPEEKIVLTDICGIHICGCGLFGEFRCDTSQLLTKHSGLKKICDALLNHEEEQAEKNSESEEE